MSPEVEKRYSGLRTEPEPEPEPENPIGQLFRYNPVCSNHGGKPINKGQTKETKWKLRGQFFWHINQADAFSVKETMAAVSSG
jgi:hypothetical protein